MQKAKDNTRQREVAARLRALRLELNLEQFRMAELIGITPARWCNYENGKRQFDYDVAVELCDQTRKLRPAKTITLDWIYRGLLQSYVDLGMATRLKPRVRAAMRHMIEAEAKRRKKPPRVRRAKRVDHDNGAPV
jgi:transcriptional regulator with XRE-family HTH domain